MGLALRPPRESAIALPPYFACTIRRDDVEATVVLAGELDVLGAPDLRDELSQLLRDDHLERIVIDLKDLAFIDSRGLGVLAFYAQRAERDFIEFSIVRPATHIAKVFRLAELGSHIRH